MLRSGKRLWLVFVVLLMLVIGSAPTAAQDNILRIVSNFDIRTPTRTSPMKRRPGLPSACSIAGWSR